MLLLLCLLLYWVLSCFGLGALFYTLCIVSLLWYTSCLFNMVVLVIRLAFAGLWVLNWVCIVWVAGLFRFFVLLFACECFSYLDV